MNLFRSRQSVKISEKEPLYSVGYLGQMSTVYVRGDCSGVERPVSALWSNYIERLTEAGVAVDPRVPSGPVPGCCVLMKLTVCASGLRTQTGDATEFWSAHRIAFASWQRSRALFVWIYRHEASKLQRVELRCHVVVCASDAVAEKIAVSLRQRLRAALSEYARERTRRQNARLHLTRLVQQRGPSSANHDNEDHHVDVDVVLVTSLPSPPSSSSKDADLTRTRLLCVGKHYRPPASPTLTVIDEDVAAEGDVLEQRSAAAGGSMELFLQQLQPSNRPLSKS